MKKKKLLFCIGIIVSIFSLVFTFIYYKSNNILTIYTHNDSYAYKYAKINMINTYNLSDSSYKDFYKVWEDFKFNVENDGIAITKYVGISEELIIPITYKGYNIVKIEKGALPSNVKKVFLPNTVKTFDVDDFSNIEILCYKGKYCEDLKENEKLKVTILDDVDRYLNYEDELEFSYNIINNNEVELTNYLGEYDSVLIPETINGYKVTSLKFDGSGIIAIFIPKTVNSISGNITSKFFNKCFLISVGIILMSLIVYCLSLLLIKIYDLIDNAYVFSISIIYLIVTNCFVYFIHNNPLETRKYLIFAIIASVIYIVISCILRNILKNNKKFDEDRKIKHNFIKETNLLLQDYDYEELKDIHEMIRYSDPISIEEVKEIEEEIKNEIKSLNDDNVTEEVKKIKKLINKRNTIIKDNK